MSQYRERDQIDRILHPERQWVGPPMPMMMDPKPFWDLPEYQGPLDKGPSAANYLQYYAENTKDPNYDPTKKLGDLNDKSTRLEVLNSLTQQNDGTLQSNEKCGAYVLLGGALLSGGNKGITTLMDSVEKFNKKNGGSLDPETLKKEGAEFQAIREKLAKGEELTAGDMTKIAGNVYDMMRQQKKDGSDAGTDPNRVDNLFRESPELAKMWKENDLSYDRIDGTGAGVGSHAVLGIGHGRKDKDHTGEHGAIYDPFRRTSKDMDLKRAAIDAAGEVSRLEDLRKKATDPELISMYAAEVATAKQLLADAEDKERKSHKDMGQIVSDPKSVAMYRDAARESIEIGPDGKPRHIMMPDVPLPSSSLWDGQY